MTLTGQVEKQVQFMGKSPGGCKLLLRSLLDDGRSIFQFMQLFDERAIKEFYYKNREEIDTLCSEEDELTAPVVKIEPKVELTGSWEYQHAKFALEKILMLIESEIKR